nr:hypothetical protein [Bacteroides sp.]
MKKISTPSAASSKDFGLVMGLVAAVVAAITGSVTVMWVAAGLLAVAVLIPALYSPFTAAWLWLGAGLERVTTAMLLGVVYYIVVTPVGLLRRRGRRKLHQTSLTDRRHTYSPSDFSKQYIDF